MANLIGETLGGYQITEQIGKGGMATIYKAFQPSLEREVAIKVLPPYFAEQDESFITRFQREARSIANLRHPNILVVMDSGRENDYFYIVMEYIHAGTLKELLESRKLALAAIAGLIAQIASALDYAHEQGIVHRDIKPSNIMLPKENWALLTDFGLAKMVGGSMLTQSGMTVGTPAYMSPEQGSGKPIDHRTDIYALGVMLYEMTVGEVPYTAETPMAVVVKHITEPLPMPRARKPDMPEAVQRVILKALAKAPEDRYQSAGELAAAFSTAAADSPEWSAANMPTVAATAPTIQTTQTPAVTTASSPGDLPQGLETTSSENLLVEQKRANPLIWIGLVFGGLAAIGVIGFFAWTFLGDRFMPANPINTSVVGLTPAVNLNSPAQNNRGFPLNFQNPPLPPAPDPALLNFGDAWEEAYAALDAGDLETARLAFYAGLLEDIERYNEFISVVERVYRNFGAKQAATLLETGMLTDPVEIEYPENYNWLGYLYQEAEEYNLAVQKFAYAIHLDPAYGDSYWGLYYSIDGLTDAEQQQVVDFLDGLLAEGVQTHELYSVLGSIYSDRGETQRGVELLQQAVDLSPDDPWGYLDLAYGHLWNNQPLQAFEDAEQALSLAPNDASIVQSAVYIMNDLERYTRSIELLEQLLRIEPDNPWNYVQLAETRANRGDPIEQVQPYIDQAIEFGQDDPDVLMSVGWLYQGLDLCPAAIDVFEMVLALDSERGDAREAINDCN
jgi:serine/threonine protein kinase/Tfp pilus assembly protein PilF